MTILAVSDDDDALGGEAEGEQRDLGGEEVAEQGAVVDWDGLGARLLHETQLHIIEAMRWIDRPLSSTELSRLLDPSLTHQNVSHHLGRLAEMGVVTLVFTSPRRGKAKFFRLVSTDE